MKKLFGIGILLFAVVLPVLAQWRLSGDDQRRFDSYYSRWQDARQRNDRDDIQSMERRMLDVYAHYNIPPQTPFWRVASNARNDDYDHDRRDRDHDRDRDRDRDQWRGRLSPDDQSRFDSYFSRWQDSQSRNDRGQAASMERRMQDIYAHYNIPAAVPYSAVASNARNDDYDHDRRDRDRWNRDQWRGRLSPDDQAKFDSYFTRWQNYKRTNNGSEVRNMERRMFDLMQRYGIPQQVPFEQIASR